MRIALCILALNEAAVSRCESFPVFLRRRVSSPASMTTQSDVVNVDAYPLSQLSMLPKKYTQVKIIHFLRHAEGTHNVNNQYRDILNLDARLTLNGMAQCIALRESAILKSGQSYNKMELPLASCELIVTSTLTRCAQTAQFCFPHLSDVVPWVAHESIRETVNYACDRRRPISDLRREFPKIDFSHVSEDKDVIWDEYDARLGSDWDCHRESAELYRVADRGRSFLNWLSQRTEQNVIVCTHSAFLRCIMSWGHDGGVKFMMDQTLDDRRDSGREIPLFNYCGDQDFEEQMRADFKNCEMRSLVIAFD